MKEHNLDYKLEFCSVPENTNLYDWAIQEFSGEKQIGRDQIPYRGWLDATATALAYNRELLARSTREIFEAYESPVPPHSSVVVEETISGNLYPGNMDVDGSWHEAPLLSMLGTERRLHHLKLRILRCDNDQPEETCVLSGRVESSDPFFVGDGVEVNVWLHDDKFEELADLITNKLVDRLVVSLDEPEGFYAYWSPNGEATRLKILCSIREQQFSQSLQQSVPSLGKVAGFRLLIVSQQSLNPISSHKPVNVDMLIDGYVDQEYDALNTLDAGALSRIKENNALASKLLKPLWVLVLLVGLTLYVVL